MTSRRAAAITEAAGTRFYDLWHGTRIEAAGHDTSIDIEGHGFGAVLAIPSAAQWPGLDALFEANARQSEKPLASFSNEWHFFRSEL